MKRYTVKDFRKQFPNEDACLEWLKNHLYPNGIFCVKCQDVTAHHKVANRRSYSCQGCGRHIYPTANTIYHKSTTPLVDWFYATYLMSSTRCGIAAKQLERELGCTYKTAWRMFHLIRTMLDESETKIGGSGQSVEIDETWVGSKGHKRKAGVPTYKTVVAGAVERKGSVIAKVVPDTKRRTLVPFITDHVKKETMLYTDEHKSYTAMRHQGFQHRRVNHSTKVWVRGDIHTNSIEGFWSLMKGGIRGVYKHVSPKNLQTYVDEFCFRYNRRQSAEPMFLSFLSQVRKYPY
ncbi:MAG: IS1595 family transposase [Pyrinomonadaceae bacterium]